uniref:Gamma-glutamyl cyclotransferase verK n=1 Tax=Clonostachys rogersoniana TaxID=122658 RepID=VERK_CLORO|nr:RecName: Full=Gamma-glutamyl cyclotransferase verK; Short=GGCT verK; AltName: Full=Verticillin biosynthesis cluster protein K [Clonostachys rogersoniana]AQZ42164.1 putative Gamma-glutamylcyclotransferase [Gliocladium sp.]
MTNTERSSSWKASSIPDQPMWYFGYGSNMKASSMADRKVTPLSTKIVTVPTHFVTFDIFGIPYSEPSYASLEQFPDGGTGKLDLVHHISRTQVLPACGVAHLLSPNDFHRLLVTEGSGVVYNLVEVQAYEMNKDGQPIPAPFTVHTLKAKWPQRPNGTPSARYMVRFLGLLSSSTYYQY